MMQENGFFGGVTSKLVVFLYLYNRHFKKMKLSKGTKKWMKMMEN